jgi:hypothetical protein
MAAACETCGCFSRITDLEPRIRHLYKDHPQVSVAFRKWAKKFEFAKYVRNILVGHTNAALITKAIEWKPELRDMERFFGLAPARGSGGSVPNLGVRPFPLARPRAFAPPSDRAHIHIRMRFLPVESSMTGNLSGMTCHHKRIAIPRCNHH